MLPFRVFSGAWPREKGGGYYQLAGHYFFSNKNFDIDGNRVDSGRDFTDYNITFYGEYGINNEITLLGKVPYKWLKSDTDDEAQPTTSNNGIGDITLGTKLKLYKKEKFGILSLQGLIKIPEAYDKDDSLALGNGQYDIEFRLLYGKSLWPKPMYGGIEFGYRKRFENPSDEYRYLLEFGYSPTLYGEKFSLRTKLDGILSVKNADRSSDPGQLNPDLARQFDLITLELTAGYHVTKRWTLQFQWAPRIYGENIAAGNTFSTKLVYKTLHK